MATGNAQMKRPGMFSTHRGRAVMAVLILAVVLMFAFSVVSGMIRDDSGSAAATTDPSEAGADPSAAAMDPSADPIAQMPERAPKVEVNPADPFVANRAATIPDEFASSDNYDSMMRAAEDAALALGTYSPEMTPEEFVDQVPALSSEGREALLKQAEDSWSNVEDGDVSVVTSVSGVEPTVRSFSEAGHLAALEVMVNQRSMKDGAEQQTRSAGYVVYLQGVPQEEDDADGADDDSAPSVDDPLEWRVMGAAAM